MFMGIAKDGILLWGPTFLIESCGLDLADAAFSAALLPLCGLIGVFTSGWLSARFFQSREIPIAALMLIALSTGILGLALFAPLGELTLVLTALCLIGATSYGANAILLTALPLGLGDEGIVSSAAGFLDFASYVGGGFSGIMTGWLVDEWGWPVVFGFWIVVVIASVVVLLMIPHPSPGGHGG